MFDTRRYERAWVMDGERPPPRIETERLVARCWEESDASLLASALDRSLDHLRTWLPGLVDGPADAEPIERQLSRYRSEFFEGVGFVYGLFDRAETEVVGGAALMPRIGPAALEIGYWIRVDRVNRGLATEATRALTAAGLALPEVRRIEIHCDPSNGASAAVPRKLGYRLGERRRAGAGTDAGDPRATLVFVLEEESGRSPSVDAGVRFPGE